MPGTINGLDPARYPKLHGSIGRVMALYGLEEMAVVEARPSLFKNPLNIQGWSRPPRLKVTRLSLGFLEGLDEGEIDSIVAHELSHISHFDFTVMAASFILFAVLAVIVGAVGLIGFLGCPCMATLLLVLLTLGYLRFLGFLSRQDEARSDRESLRRIGKPDSFKSALVKFYEEGERMGIRPGLPGRLQVLTGPMYPPLEARLAMAERYRRKLERKGRRGTMWP